MGFVVLSSDKNGRQGYDGLKRHSFKRYGNALKSIIDVAEEWGIEVEIDRKSTSYTNVTMSDGWIYTIMKD